MTISSEVRKSGPYPGNGVADTFPFDFKIFEPEDLLVVLTIDGAEHDLEFGDDYGVSLNSDQENSPGGEVVLNTPLPSGQLLTLTSAAKNLQPTKITNQGAFYPEVVNQALDRLTILVQQVDEKVGRSVKVPISSTVTPDDLISQLTSDAASAREAASSAEQTSLDIDQKILVATQDFSEIAQQAEESKNEAATYAASMGKAIAMAATFTSVPSTFQAWEIIVTLPHLRKMVWSAAQSKYVRAPWHQPCEIFFSYDNPLTIPGALPVRVDASWNQADFPDVVARLGLSGTGTFTLVEARGEFLRVLDNGRGKDVGRVLRSHAASLVGPHTHNLVFGGGNLAKPTAGAYTTGGGGSAIAGSEIWGGAAGSYAAASGSGIGTDTYPTNLAFPLWMTY